VEQGAEVESVESLFQVGLAEPVVAVEREAQAE